MKEHSWADAAGVALSRVGLAVLAVLWLPMTAAAQAYPQASYDPAIPTLEDVVGHATGEQVSDFAEITEYFQALEAAAPERMDIVPYATSWQGRELFYAVISSPENMANLDASKAAMDRLAGGSGLSSGVVSDLAGSTPAVVWLSYNIHGDEISPADSALFMAYHLLAAQNDGLVETVLDNVIVIIDPSQNPDGRDRFVHSFKSALGLEPQADRYTAEHDQPWPGGRYNHYLFDMNRDWFSMTQPETQGKVASVLEWHPVVYVDSHEMGGDETYYFPPPADPYNPHITAGQRAKQIQMGRNHGAWFDRFGVPYFTREVFDAFYPGYGDMWPGLNGAISMTFEQASARGLVFARNDGKELTYADGVRNNVLSSLSTLEVVARNKAQYLTDYVTYRRSAVTEGSDAEDRYVVFDLSERRYEAEALGRRLVAQGIAVQRVAAGSRQCGQDYASGALVVDLAQPQGRLARTLLSTNTPLPEDFITEQESRRARGLRHQLYDVTAWSMPLMDGVTAQSCRRVDLSGASVLSADESIPSISGGSGAFGYAVPWTDSGQARLVIAALKAGLEGKTTDTAFTQAGRVFPAGTAVFPATGNPANLGARLAALAEEIGAEVVPMSSSWVDDGPNFGSGSFAALKMPRVAIAWGEGTSATSAGNTRFVLERELGLPVAPIRMSTLGWANLSAYDVLILPDTGWGGGAEAGAETLKEFVSGGGVLIAFSDSVSTVAGEDYGLLSTKLELAASEEDADDGGEGRRAPALMLADEAAYRGQIADHHAHPEDVPGVLVKAEADQDHWLAAGYDSATALVTGSSIYRPLNMADGTNVFRFAGADELLLSGYLWEENRAQLAYKPFVMAQPYGGGVTIGFTQEPTTRAYLNGLNLLLANAVVLGPARMAH